MGSILSIIKRKLAKHPLKILVLGLDNAGKTTLLYKLKVGEVVSTNPTIGFNVEEIKYKNLNLICWDIGGQKKIRQLWRHYYYNTDVIIFIVDSNDTSDDRISTIKEELHGLMNSSELSDAILLVYANKQDLLYAKSTSEIASDLELSSINRQWHIQACCCNTGSGIYEGLDWISDTVKSNNK
jgi:ADP-ribosylation factor 1/2